MRKWLGIGGRYLRGIKAMRRIFCLRRVLKCDLRFIASLSKDQKPYSIQFYGSENCWSHNDCIFTCMASFERSPSKDKNRRKSAIYIFQFHFLPYPPTSVFRDHEFRRDVFKRVSKENSNFYPKPFVNFMYRKHTHIRSNTVYSSSFSCWNYDRLSCFLDTFSSDRALNVPVSPCRQSVFSQWNAKKTIDESH